MRLLILTLILTCLTAGAGQPPNLLLITVDDMSADSLGCFGSKLAETSPNIDALAAESLKFEHAHVQVGNCYPSRNVMLSGLYPHNNRVEGFYKVQNDYPTLSDLLKKSGYYTGIRGKVSHSTPYHPYPGWDEDLTVAPDGSRYHIKDVASYGTSTARGIAAAGEAGKPFFLNVNISDPHKPFWKPGDRHPSSKEFAAGDVPVPGFLFDHPDIREELALYYTSVRRADDAVGSIIGAFEESGEADNTIVVFLSDHGMPLPFAKTALWHHSTHTPLLVQVPGTTKPGSVDAQHVVSAVDFVPTFLDLLGLPHPEKLDGHSFAPAIRGEHQPGHNAVFKVYNENAGGGRHPMRAIQTKDYLYLWNPWADGSNKFKTATTGTASYRTMQRVAATDPEIARRLELFDHRVPEEIYHIKSDPDCLHNLIGETAHGEALDGLRLQLEAVMRQSKDHALEAFLNRAEVEAGHAYTATKQAESDARRAKRRTDKNGGKQKPEKRAGRKLISLGLPEDPEPGKEVTLAIHYNLRKAIGTQQIHVTLKLGKAAMRHERKVLPATGKGTAEVSFSLPATIPEQQIVFSVFIGPDFKNNLQHLTSDPIPTKD